MKVIMGPARCIECRARVWWAYASNGRGRTWRNADGSKHDC